MNFFAMKRGCTIGAMALIGAVVSACGGGGGSGGENINQPYDLTLRAETRADGTPKTELPLNLNLVPPSISATDGPFTTTLYIDAITSNRPVPSGEFACAMVEGLEVGWLYRLDGTDTEVDGVIQGSRSIVLGANSGSASFHFQAWNSAGTAKIRCTLENNQNRFAEISIQVGEYTGNPSGAYIETTTTGNRGYLYTQGVAGDSVGPMRQLTMQASVFDDFGQPVATPTGNNLRVSILPNQPFSNPLAAQDAVLRGAGNSIDNQAISVRTVNGRATFTIVSGNEPGPIALLLESNRLENGIAVPVRNISVVYAVDQIPNLESPAQLVSEDANYTALMGREFFQALPATGGIPPYRWSIGNGTLPAGLSLSSNGVISGIPTALGSRTVQLVVQDSAADSMLPFPNQRITSSVTINVEPSISNLAILCANDAVATSTCEMTNALVGLPYIQALSARGGTGTYTWQVTSLPSFLTFDATNLQIRSNRALTCGDLNITTVTEVGEDDVSVTTTTYSDRTYGYLVTLRSGSETISTLARMTVNQDNAVCN